MNPPLNEPTQDGPHLEHHSGKEVYPGGLVEPLHHDLEAIGTDTESLYLGFSDELGPTETLFVSSISLENLTSHNGRTFSSDGEAIYVLDIFLKSGSARRHYCQPKHLRKIIKKPSKKLKIPNSQWVEEGDVGRGRRARGDLIMLARTNELAKRVDLDYMDKSDKSNQYPPACNLYMSNFLRRVRRSAGSFPWLEVLEYGRETMRLHHHLLVPKWVDSDLMKEKWTHGGLTKIRQANSLDEIANLASYVTKTFEEPENQRPRTRRYRVARCIEREQPVRIIGTYEDVEKTFQRMLPKDSNPKQWMSDHPYSAGGCNWDRPI